MLLGTVAVALIVTGAALYLRYIRLPADYVDPATIPRPVLDARTREFRARANEVASRVLSGEPFDVTFTDDAVNATIATTLAHTGRAWFDHLDVPDEIDGIQLRFHAGGVVLFGRLDRGAASCIVGATVRVSVNEQGDLDARVVGVRGGRLPIQRALVRRVVSAVEDRPTAIRLGGGRRARLQRVHLAAGTIRLVGGPGERDE